MNSKEIKETKEKKLEVKKEKLKNIKETMDFGLSL